MACSILAGTQTAIRLGQAETAQILLKYDAEPMMGMSTDEAPGLVEEHNKPGNPFCRKVFDTLDQWEESLWGSMSNRKWNRVWRRGWMKV
jgi:hypothetical protein